MFLKENYVIALLGSRYLLKKYLAWNGTSCFDSAYGVSIH